MAANKSTPAKNTGGAAKKAALRKGTGPYSSSTSTGRGEAAATKRQTSRAKKQYGVKPKSRDRGLGGV